MRRVLPQRRTAETFDLRFWNRLFTVTVGFYPDNSLGEIFVGAARPALTSRASSVTPAW
jgi:hypothetical protein